MSMFDMDQFMADREASYRRRPLCEEERDTYWGGAPERNVEREDGVDRCFCGCKYWEGDRCIDCGGTEAE